VTDGLNPATNHSTEHIAEYVAYKRYNNQEECSRERLLVDDKREIGDELFIEHYR